MSKYFSSSFSRYQDRILRTFLFFLIGIIPQFLCSCSTIESGCYLVAHTQDQGIAVPQDAWLTYGLNWAGKSSRHRPEHAVGCKRPMVYRRSFDNEQSYILYPVILDERALFFGPILLPVLPVWFMSETDTNALARACSVAISWYGDVPKAEKIVVRCFDSGEWLESVRRVFVKKYKHLECVYSFEKRLTEDSVIVMEYTNGEKIEQRVSFTSEWGLEWLPSIQCASGLLGAEGTLESWDRVRETVR